MADIYWLYQVNGSFTNAADWAGGVTPGPDDVAILDASADTPPDASADTPFTVTVTADRSVSAIQTPAGATLAVNSAFTASDGTGSGVNAGAIDVQKGSFTLGGVFDNAGGGVIDASGGAVELQSADIVGGTLESSNGFRIYAQTGSNTFDGTASPVDNTGRVNVDNGVDLTLLGTIVNAGAMYLTGSTLPTTIVIGAGGVTLDGAWSFTAANPSASSLFLSFQGANQRVIGATATTTLTIADERVSGQGQLGCGQLIIDVEADGFIEAKGDGTLFVDTGANTIVNAGLIDAEGYPESLYGPTVGLVESPVENSGVIEANGEGASLIFEQPVIDAGGHALIAGGILQFMSSFDEDIGFTESSGEVILAQSQDYTSTILAFSTIGGESLDLQDIGFVNAGEATFSGKASGGVLTVTDGTHTAHIHLADGDYVGVTFIASSDGAGGTLITDPTPVDWLSAESADFDDADDWAGGVVPGADDDAILGAGDGSPYTVTGAEPAVVNSIQTAPNATLDVTGSLTANNGDGSGVNAGAIVVSAGGALSVGGTVVNSGTILIEGSAEVRFTHGLANSGTIGGAGTLVLAGAATAFAAGTSLTVTDTAVSGAVTTVMVATDLSYAGTWTQTAGTLSVASGEEASFTGRGDSFAGTLAGAGTIALAGGADTFWGPTISVANLTISNAVTVAELVRVSGALTSTGTIAGHGTLALFGPAAFGTGASLTVAKVVQTGAAQVTVDAADLDYAGAWTEEAGTVSVAAGGRLDFTGAGDLIEGTLSGAGKVAFTGGSDEIDAASLSASSMIINGAGVTLAGVITLSGVLTAANANLIVGAGAGDGARLTGGGTLALTDAAGNAVRGAGAASTLTNVDDVIEGAGQLGGGRMILVNDARGIIDGDQSVALTLDTGTSTIANAGTIEATQGGSLTIEGAIRNTGVLAAADGRLIVDGAVTGAGAVKVGAGVAEFGSSFTENVDFTGVKGGVLELADSRGYTGALTGFSRTGATALDLDDILFADAPTWVYRGAAGSGVLTIKDRDGHTASILLEGDYLASTFVLSAGPGGGTKVVDPAPDAPRARLTHALVQAMAGLATPAGAASATDADPWRSHTRPLAHPLATPGIASA